MSVQRVAIFPSLHPVPSRIDLAALIRMRYETVALEAAYEGLYLGGVWRSDLVGTFSVNLILVARIARAFR